jgi:RHS repeat-associated protein
MQLGNGTWEKTLFNSRMQPTQIALGETPGATNLLKLDYSYGDWVSGSINTSKNNGNIVQQVITVPIVGQSENEFTASQKYYYDSLNRIDDATEHVGSNQTWRQDFQYDRYGNRRFNLEPEHTTVPAPNCTEAICNPTISTSTNRITSTGWLYDSAGNTTRDGEYRTFTYDGENKQVLVKNSSNVTRGEYWYDGDGRRIKKKAYDPSGILTEETIFVYDASGKLIEEYSTNVAALGEAEVAYTTNDHLGSPRINTDRDGDVISRHDYHPFGEEITIHATNQGRLPALGYAPDAIRKQFTSYERDGETNLDYAESRYLSTNLGRFTSTDPVIMSPGRAIDPQQINLYIYTRNNPLKYVDPDGEDINEPTGLNEKEQKRYDDWKAKLLSTEEGRKKWDQYANDKSFILNVTMIDRGSDSRNASAEVKDFKFDSSGKFTEATMELGNNLGASGSQDPASYPIGSTLGSDSGIDAHTRAAYKIAHEFGHVDDFRGQGRRFYEEQSAIYAMEDLRKGRTPTEYMNDPKIEALRTDFQTRFGKPDISVSRSRDINAERNAIPIIRQLLGKKISGKTERAMKTLEANTK